MLNWGLDKLGLFWGRAVNMFCSCQREKQKMCKQNNRKEVEVWTNLSLAALARANGSTVVPIPLSAAEGAGTKFPFFLLSQSLLEVGQMCCTSITILVAGKEEECLLSLAVLFTFSVLPYWCSLPFRIAPQHVRAFHGWVWWVLYLGCCSEWN